MPKKGIKNKLFISFGTLSVVLCILFTTAIISFTQITERLVINRLMDTEVHHILQSPATWSPPSFMKYYDSYDNLPDDVKLVVNKQCNETRKCDYKIEIREISSTSPKSFLVVDVTKFTPATDYTPELIYMILLVKVVFIVAALVTAYLISKSISTPLISLANDVQQVSSNTQVDFKHYFSDDETGILARKLDSSLNQLYMALQRESEFTNDVSHELRTPVSAVKNTITLLESGVCSKDIAFEQIKRSNTEIEEILDNLLALARNENLSFSSVNFSEIVEECLIRGENYGLYSVEVMKLSITDSFEFFGNSELLIRVSQNLINNAFQHGEPGTIFIYESGRSFIFENKPSITTMKGLGKGLLLARRICNIMAIVIEVIETDDLFRVSLTQQQS